MVDLIIDDEIKNLCPPLKDQELEFLEENLLRDGCRDPLSVWPETGILLDGHNRHTLCTKHSIKFTTKMIKGLADRHAALDWVIRNQLGRRNVNPNEQAYLIGKRYQNAKMTPEEVSSVANKVARTKGIPTASVADGTRAKNITAQRIASEEGVSERAVRNADTFASAVDTIARTCGETAAEDIRSGKTKVSRDKIIEISQLPAKQQPKALAAAKTARKTPAKTRKAKPAAEPATVDEQPATPTVDEPSEPSPVQVRTTIDGKTINRQGFVMPSTKAQRREAGNETPDPITELNKLNAAWPLKWFEAYCVMVMKDTSEEGVRRRDTARMFISDLLYKLHMLQHVSKPKVEPEQAAE